MLRWSLGVDPVERLHYNNYFMLDSVIDIGGIFRLNAQCCKEMTDLAALLPFWSLVGLGNRLMRCFELPESNFIIRDVLEAEKLIIR